MEYYEGMGIILLVEWIVRMVQVMFESSALKYLLRATVKGNAG